MNTRIIETDMSVWVFDFDKNEFNRSPRGSAAHPYVPYDVDGWQPFITFEEWPDAYYEDRMRFRVQTPDDSITSTYLKEQS